MAWYSRFLGAPTPRKPQHYCDDPQAYQDALLAAIDDAIYRQFPLNRADWAKPLGGDRPKGLGYENNEILQRLSHVLKELREGTFSEVFAPPSGRFVTVAFPDGDKPYETSLTKLKMDLDTNASKNFPECPPSKKIEVA